MVVYVILLSPEACNDILEENIIYNDTGTEGNNQHDPGEEFLKLQILELMDVLMKERAV